MKTTIEANDQAKEFSEKLKVTVHVRRYELSSIDAAICFIREPSYDELAVAFEKMAV
jgi:hypothetical protein